MEQLSLLHVAMVDDMEWLPPPLASKHPRQGMSPHCVVEVWYSVGNGDGTEMARMMVTVMVPVMIL